MGNVVRNTTLSLAVAFACGASNLAYALSLGEIRVLSHLAEPFRAEINLPAASATELEDIRIQLAPDAVFEKVGLDRAALVGQLAFSVKNRPDGSAFIWVESADAIRELGLSFFVEARWQSGNLIKGYDILLNPAPSRVVPRVSASPLSNVVKATPVSETTDTVAGAINPSTVQTTRVSEKEQTLGPKPSRDLNRIATTGEKGVKFGPTLPGDTLGNIVRQIDPDGHFPRGQLLSALVQENPGAFSAGSADRLKAGYTLTISDMTNVPTLAKQFTQGAELVQQDRSARADNNAPPPDEAKQASMAPVTETVKTASATVKTKPLAIETSTAGSSVESRTALEENMAATRSEIAATKQAAQTLQAENDEMRERIAQLERTVAETAGSALKVADTGDSSAAAAPPTRPAPVSLIANVPVSNSPGVIEDFGLLFGGVAALTLLLLGFIGMRPEAREKIAEFWRTKVRREPALGTATEAD